MKAILVTNDIQLYNEFHSSKKFTTVNISQSLIFEENFDLIIVSDAIIEYNDFLSIIKDSKIKCSNIFYILSDKNEHQASSIKYILNSKGVNVISSRLTRKQVLDTVCDHLKIDLLVNSNVIAFFGADSKVGTTVTAQAVAEAIAENTEYQVCFINLSGQPSFDYVDRDVSGYGLDIIKTKIFNSILTEDELHSVMIKKDNLSILPSAKTFEDFRYYQPNHVEYLIGLASSIFDIVIVDAGFCPNSGLYIGVLNSTKNRYMITTQQESCVHMFNIVKNQILDILDIDLSNIYLVVNRFNNDLNMPNPGAIAKNAYNMILASTLPNVPGGFWLSEANKQTLRNISPDYRKALDNLVRIIAEQLNINYKDSEIKSKFSFLNFFKKGVKK